MKEDRAKKLVDDALAELRTQLDAGHSEALLQFMDCLSRFHHYSWSNLLLIASQRPDATRVAGFRKWLEFNRCVRKGEKGIAIIAPMTYRRQADDEDGIQTTVNCIRGFKVVHVFDVSQTDGEDLPEFPGISDQPGQLLDDLEGLIRDSGIELRHGAVPFGAEGVSMKGTIIVAEHLNAAETFAVLAHELAHLCGESGYVSFANLLLVRWSLTQSVRSHNRRRDAGWCLRNL